MKTELARAIDQLDRIQERLREWYINHGGRFSHSVRVAAQNLEAAVDVLKDTLTKETKP